MQHRWNVEPGTFLLIQGDITASGTQAIVNAANSRLAGGGGVDGAIQRAAGPRLLTAGQDIVARQGPVAAGQAVITPGFDLRASHVIHAVGPIWQGGTADEPRLLASAYATSLHVAARHGLRSIAFPAISCGAYGYPLELAVPVALEALVAGLRASLVDEAALYVYTAASYETWRAATAGLLGQPRA